LTSYARGHARSELGPLGAQAHQAILDLGQEPVAAADGEQAQLLGLERLGADPPVSPPSVCAVAT